MPRLRYVLRLHIAFDHDFGKPGLMHYTGRRRVVVRLMNGREERIIASDRSRWSAPCFCTAMYRRPPS